MDADSVINILELDVLRVKNVPATFFALGSRANAFPELKNEGYTFVTVEEMVQEKGVSLSAGSYYGRFD